MAQRTHLIADEKWVRLLENHADGYSAMVFASVVLHNSGNVPIFYSSHQDAPELSHSTLLPGRTVGVITRHLMVRPDGGDGTLEMDVTGLTTISSD
ncbi:MAG: hypothetical protein ABUL49_01195 [bacterium]